MRLWLPAYLTVYTPIVLLHLQETCHETAENSGVFVRDYTKATVTMDCNSWTGTVTPK